MYVVAVYVVSTYVGAVYVLAFYVVIRSPTYLNTTITNSKIPVDHPRFFWDAKIFLDDVQDFSPNMKLGPLGDQEGRFRT